MKKKNKNKSVCETNTKEKVKGDEEKTPIN